MQLRIFLAFAALLTLTAMSVALWTGRGVDAGMAGAALALIAGAWWSIGSRSRIEPVLATRLEQGVAQGKRLALYDHETGLLAQWYFTMRFAEECDRATRYGHSFSVILLETDRLVQAREDRLLDWMRKGKRSTDLVGCLTTGRYLMLLPDTDAAGATLALKSLRRDVKVAGSIAEFPHDGADPAELQDAAELRLRAHPQAA